MRRVVATAAVLLAIVVGIVGMAELTQNRPDAVVAGSATTVDLAVATRAYRGGQEAAAAAVWAVCASTVDAAASPPVPVADSDGDRVWRVRFTPALGEHGRKRLLGCLQDITLDRVVGDVVAVRSHR